MNLFFTALVITSVATFLSASAFAQQVTVAITPVSANTYGPGPMVASIQWCAVGATLDSATRTITFNSQNAIGSFTWVPGTQAGCDDYAVSSGTVTLGGGTNSFYAQVSASYTPPPPPQCPPVCDQRPPPGFALAESAPEPLQSLPLLDSPVAEYVTGYASADWGTSAPIVSLAPYASGVLTSGFEVVFSHSTPAYFSLGQPRALTIVYNSSTVRPTPVIWLDVSQGAWSSPTAYFVQVRKGTTLLKLLNDSTFVYFATSTGTPVRLALALDAQANLLATGWHDVTVTVTAIPSNQSTTVGTRVLVVDQAGSSFGKGIGLAGVQRVRTMTGSYSVLVTEGDGSAIFFANVGECPTCSTFTTPAGEASTFSKVNDPTLGSIYRRRYPDGSIMDFASSGGRILRAAGRFGDTTRYTWTDTLLTQIRDAMGKTLTLAYSSGKLQSVTDPAGRVTTYALDGNGRLYRVTDPDTLATNLGYDTNSLLTGVTDRGGALTTFTYDALRRIDTTYAPTIQLYSGANVRPRTIVTSPERIVWQPNRAGTDTATKKAAVRPDTLFAIAVGPNGATGKAVLDRFGSATKLVRPYGETTTMTRDTLGRALVTTEPNGHVTRLSYRSPLFVNESPYLVGQTKDSTTGRTISYGYVSASNLLASVSGDIARQDFVYHTGSNGPAGAVDSVFGANRSVLYSVHRPDALGRDTLITDGGQHATHFKYDSVSGNVRESTGPTGSVTRFHYDPAGRVDSAWVPASGVFTYQYDLLNRQTQVKNPLGHITQFVYGPTTAVLPISGPVEIVELRCQDGGVLLPLGSEFARGAAPE